MKDPGYLDWLFQNGGPVTRYLIIIRQRGSKKWQIADLRNKLVGSEEVKYWLRNLTGGTGANDIHGSGDACFENAMGKLTQYGLRRGMGSFDQRCAPYLSWLETSMNVNKGNVISVFHQTIVAAWLAVAGYLSEPPVRDFVMGRLNTIHDFVREKDYSIYVDRSRFNRIPAAYRAYPLVDPDLYVDGNFALPWIHDVFAFRELQSYMKDDDIEGRIGRVISYILDRRYQHFHEGYGVVQSDNNHYNVMGWDVRLPFFGGVQTDASNNRCLVQRLELMSCFSVARSSGWFTENVKVLEDFRNRHGRYVLPRDYVYERKNSYFVTGAHMGFGENRRRRIVLEIESSLWMLKIMGSNPKKDVAK